MVGDRVYLHSTDHTAELTTSKLKIKALADGEAIPFDLLELADPSRKQIESYLKTSSCHIITYENLAIGVLVLQAIDSTRIEIKNIAILPSEQGKGLGTQLLNYAEEYCRKEAYKSLIIGTGNSSIGQLALYQKLGFEIAEIKHRFFLEHYSEPIFENGIQCKHMIVLKKDLTCDQSILPSIKNN